jgi:hypothetical protein
VEALVTRADACIEIEQSNWLAELADRIRVEHQAVSTALKESLRHAIEAGELLIEAKKQVGHGQWLPWLQERCAISERTAQLYMRVAKNRKEIEEQIRNGIADLSLNEAAALLMLSSEVKKLLDFDKSCGDLSAEEIIQTALDQRVAILGVMKDDGYRVFAHCTPEGERDWHLFVLYLSVEHGWYPENAAEHVEYLSQKQFMNPDEWLGDEGERFRRCAYKQPKMGKGMLRSWAAFKEVHRERTQAEIIAEVETIRKERGPAPPPRLRKRRPQRAT